MMPPMSKPRTLTRQNDDAQLSIVRSGGQHGDAPRGLLEPLEDVIPVLHGALRDLICEVLRRGIGVGEVLSG